MRHESGDMTTNLKKIKWFVKNELVWKIVHQQIR